MLHYINMYSNITKFLCQSVILKRNMITLHLYYLPVVGEFVSNFFVKNASPDWNIPDCSSPTLCNFRLFETSNLVLLCSEQNRHIIFEITDIFKVVKGSKFLKMEKVPFSFLKYFISKHRVPNSL